MASHGSFDIMITDSQEKLLTKLMAVMNMAVFEYLSEKQGLQLVGAPPPWLLQVFPEEELKKPTISLTKQVTFLEHFFQDAQLHWNSRSAEPLHSGMWQEGRNPESQFEAIALLLGIRKLLLIQRLGSASLEWQNVLQKARERTLSHNQEITQQKNVHTQLGKRLDESQQLNEDLISLLNQLHIGTIMVNDQNQITFINRTGERLIGKSLKNGQGLYWKKILSLNLEELSALAEMSKRPMERREKISVQFQGKGKNPFSVEIDIKDNPRFSTQKIWYLYDRTEVYQLRHLLDQRSRFHDMVGKSHAMQTVFQRIQDIGILDATALISGETGTGKELVARALHTSSPRQDRPFIAVNCAGLTDSLLGSQLFGHKRGSFTGAFEDHRGFFESADGGTIFLDEIGDMPLPVQASLLRVLQEKEIIRLGESKPRKINVRIVAATNRNLQDLVTAGQFRTDLLYRIRVARIDLPPLRDRREDLPLLASLFLTEAKTESRKQVDEIGTEAMQCLLRYRWPGNVRELKSAIDFAVIHCPTSLIQIRDLPPELTEPGSPIPEPATHERDTIIRTLDQVKGNRAAAARLLGISRATFYRRLNELEIAQVR